MTGTKDPTLLADRWGINPEQFWLRGRVPERSVSYDPKKGMWNVYGYRDVVQVLSDPATYSSETFRLLPERKEFTEGSIISMDPPLHQKLRKLVSHAFTPKVIADLEPRIAELTHELLDRAEAAGDRIDLVADLAYPLPVIVIAELLGVPAEDRDLFKQWVDKLLERSGEFSLTEQSEEQEKAMETTMEQVGHLVDYLGEHAAERRRKPRGDLLTKLVEAEVDGVRLTDREVVNFANVLLIAGHITTTMLLGNTVLCLDEHPGEKAKVLTDRELVPSAIEESLRFLSPFAVTARVTNVDAELGGTVIEAEQMVLTWLAAANRDPAHFTDPGVFDVTREPNKQIAFGRGIHFCIGAPLARLEGRVALNILLDRFPGLRTDPDEAPEFIPAPTMTGVRKLPLLLKDS
ncbi:cytochrome P450 [Amycolatopsis sp. YIM 10]|uniref:cytochrome P450 n=1 Tax=Amycolatopsis sp. YIM 10 TaxID=2653857 RepID=UPI0012907539|nr:cytochrome P450 [Amycolatopsis sp. YIM 10]QFU89022.1 Erythromycin C-12 hydroxylase [Amycolatopsis sp. YIM 10]